MLPIDGIDASTHTAGNVLSTVTATPSVYRISIAWPEVENPPTYTVSYSESGGDETVYTTTSESSIEIKDLLPETVYSVTV